jgi:DNA-binding transcriptional MerR regulator
MAEQGLLIGEVAARSGVSRKAVRLYEARGILSPSRRTHSGYRRYPADVLGLLRFVGQARRLGLTLAQIKHIVKLRRDGSAPCAHIRALLQQKAQDLEGMLAEVRRILRSWSSTNGRLGAVCPHLEAKGGEVTWRGSPLRSARTAPTARKSSSRATPSASARTRTPSSCRRRNGMSSLTSA